ncbi:sugar porter family MFS transporter [Thiotrichales bacterium 19S11-10]|nr:sugar porter family MFS transporter [Thiotrichales bacterium 19S11-10]MCF6807562.1 sugar porter family MFS transporter [Thiotrichales bacterium 19S9-11]MCF6811531.1 sugar porter family MFS transporter [Thiotrichales bacterium 19S9-12]
MEITESNYRTSYIYIVCFIAAMGGLLFGLDQGFINGSLTFIEEEMKFSVSQGESFASTLLYGCIVGALFSGMVSRSIGRKNTLILTALFFTIFSLWGATTSSIAILYFTRFCLGLAVGVASFVVPLYLSEIAPTRLRGGFIAMYQQMITVGIFLIYVSNSVIAHYFESWRIMLAVIAIPAFVMLVGTFFIPKTPRWLLLKRREKHAHEVLNKTRETIEEANLEAEAIKATLVKEKGFNWKLLGKGFVLKVLLLGVLLQFLQQLSGINSVIYYSTKIFTSAGIDNATIATVIVGLVNMITTILAVYFIDKIGRKPIIYFGLTIMIITLLTIGGLFYYQEYGTKLSNFEQYSILAATLFYIFAFAISLGPITWVICAEIFPLEIRDFGMTVTTMANWIGATLVVRFSLSIMDSLGGYVLFFIFATCCFLGLFLVKFFTPETKGVTLEEIEMNLRNGKSLRDIGK